MPYIHDVGYVLSPAQNQIHQSILETSRIVSSQRDIQDAFLGELHIKGGERKGVHQIHYQRYWGILHPSIRVTSNGSVWELVSCLDCENDNVKWVPSLKRNICETAQCIDI
jgi:hypothetical protein